MANHLPRRRLLWPLLRTLQLFLLVESGRRGKSIVLPGEKIQRVTDLSFLPDFLALRIYCGSRMSWTGALQRFGRCLYQVEVENCRGAQVRTPPPITLSGAGSENPQLRRMGLHQLQAGMNSPSASFLNHPKCQ